MIAATALIRYSGQNFCLACYILERDPNLVFQSDALLCDLESFVGDDADMFRFSSDDSKLDDALNKSVQVANLMI